MPCGTLSSRQLALENYTSTCVEFWETQLHEASIYHTGQHGLTSSSGFHQPPQSQLASPS